MNALQSQLSLNKPDNRRCAEILAPIDALELEPIRRQRGPVEARRLSNPTSLKEKRNDDPPYGAVQPDL
jgi:hypothetical protein